MIIVVNKRTHKPTDNDVYIGRPSLLGNPYSHLGYSKHDTIKVATREEAVRLYESWLKKQWDEYTPAAETMDDMIDDYMKSGIMHLVCWCAPLACHGDIIKRMMEEIIAKMKAPL